MLKRVWLCIFAAVFFLMQGCVAVQTFPTAARAGDTLTLAVGSPDGMTKTNTSVQFVSGSYTTTLPIRAIIRLKPDNTSYVGAFDAFTSTIQWQSSHAPWLSVLVIDLPVGLPVGVATLNVTTAGQYFSGANVNTTPIAVEIISGTGTPNPFSYSPFGFGAQPGDLSDLEALPQVVIRPKQNTSLSVTVTPVAAIELKVNVPTTNLSGGSIPATDLKIIADDLLYPSSNQVQMNWSRQGDEYTVNFVSPSGTLYYFQTRFSIVLSGNSNYQFATTPGPSVISVKYFDVNGNAVTTAQPAVSQYTAKIE